MAQFSAPTSLPAKSAFSTGLVSSSRVPSSRKIREIAPASELRKWFDHDAETWDGFRKRYREELDTNGAAVERCLGWCRKGPVTLLFAAKHREHNLTVILRDCLVKRIDR